MWISLFSSWLPERSENPVTMYNDILNVSLVILNWVIFFPAHCAVGLSSWSCTWQSHIISCCTAWFNRKSSIYHSSTFPLDCVWGRLLASILIQISQVSFLLQVLSFYSSMTSEFKKNLPYCTKLHNKTTCLGVRGLETQHWKLPQWHIN